MTRDYKKRGHGFVQQSVRNVCEKFKIDRLSRFRTGARHVLTTQKCFPGESPLTWKVQHQIPCTTHFLIKLSSVKFFWKFLTSNKSILEPKSKHLNSIRVFPFFMSFFCWDETNTKCSIKEDRRKIFQGEGHIYEGLSVNSCSVDVSAIKNALFEKYAEAATKGVQEKRCS